MSHQPGIPTGGAAVRFFLEWCDAPEGDRTPRLMELRRRSPRVAREVEALLAADAATEGLLERAFAEVALAAHRRPLDEPTSPVLRLERVGTWRLLERLGMGGMGEVWLGERINGGCAQQAAIKLVRTELVSDQVVARFVVERQVLARLNHPAIAKVLDGGVAADGRPWFAMERVFGLPITAFVRERRLCLEDALRLLVAVCEAVDFAHRNLVVHRDLKPSNILVTEAGEAKLLDFGLAKLLEAMPGAEFTRTAMMAFTPAYAAPEQILGGPATTAIDVYALGVLLYELLTGQLPHRRAGLTPAGLAQQVARETVQRPSAAARRHATPHDAGRHGAWQPGRLEGDLDAIALRALCREPERRYPSAAALAHDLRQWLQGRPVEARRHAPTYRVRKFVGRHRLGVAAAVVALVSLVGGLGAALTQAERARRETEHARAAARRSDRIKELAAGLLNEANPLVGAGRDLSAAQLLMNAVGRVDQGLADEPAARAELRAVIARGLLVVGEANAALHEVERSLVELHRLDLDDASPLVMALQVAAQARRAIGDLDGAQTGIEEALRMAARSSQDQRLERARLRTTLFRILLARDRGEEAAALARDNLAARQQLGADAPALAADWNNLACSLLTTGRFREAEHGFREAARLLARDPKTPQARLVWLKAGLGTALWGQGKGEEARRQQLEAREHAVRTLGPRHEMVATILTNLGVQAQLESRPREAVDWLTDALKIYADAPGEGSAQAAVVAALAHLDLGHNRSAEALLTPQLARLQATPALHPVWRAWAQAALGLARARVGLPRQGEGLARRALQELAAAGMTARREYADAARCLAMILEEHADPDARRWRERAHAAYRDIYGAGHPVSRAAAALGEAAPLAHGERVAGRRRLSAPAAPRAGKPPRPA